MKRMRLWGLVAMCCGVAAGTAFGQTEYLWSLGNNGNWGVNANWSPNSGFPIAGDTAVFSNATGRTITIDANPRSAASVNVRAGAWTWSGTSPNNLNVSGLFDYANTSIGAAGVSTLSAILSGNGGLRVSSGRLLVSGSNTFLGATALTGGQMQLGNDAALGNTAQTLSLGSGTLSCNGASRVLGNPVTLDGNTVFGSGVDTQQRSLTFTNTATLTGSRVIKVYGAESSGVGSWSRDAIFNRGITDGVNSFTLTTSSDNPSTTTGNGHGYLKLMGNSEFKQLIVNGCVVQLSATNTLEDETQLGVGADTNRPGVLLIGNNAALGSPALRILGGSIHTASADQTVTNDLYLDANLTSSTLGAADKYLTFGGTTTLSASRIFNTADKRHLGFSGAIVDGGNNYSITKQGLGYLRLAGASTFDGGVRVEAGKLLVHHNDALGTGTLTITNTVGLQHLIQSTTITVPNNIQLDGDIVNVSISDPADRNTTLKTTGTTTLSGNRTISVAADGNGSRGTIELAGTVTDGAGSYSLTKVGTGTMTLSGTLDLDGGVTVYAGRVNLPNANPSYAGRIRLIPGRSIAYFFADNPINPSIFLGNDQGLGTGTFEWEGTPVYRSAPYPYGRVAIVQPEIGASPGYVAPANNVILSGYVGVSAGVILGARTTRFTHPTPTLGGDAIFTAYSDGNGDRALAFTGGLTDGANSFLVGKVGSGSLSLLGDNAFDGPLSVYQGTVYLTGDNTAMTGVKTVYAGTLQALARTGGSLLGPAALTLADSSALLRLDASSTVSDTALPGIVFDKAATMIWTRGVASGTTWTTPSLTRTGRSVLQFAGGTASAGALTANDKFKVTGWTDPASGMIAPYYREQTGDFLTYDAAGVGVKRTAYSGGDINTNLSTAIYTPTGAQTLGANRSIYALKTGFNIAGSGLDLTLGSGGLSINANTPVISCNLQFNDKEALIWNSVASTISGAIKGSGGLTKAAAGTLTLNSANSYTGETTIHAGQITLGVAGALPTAQSLTVNNATLELNGQSIAPSAITMSGGQILNSSATASTLTLPTNIIFNGGYNQANIWPASTRTLNTTLTGPTTFAIANGYSEPDMRIGDSANSRYVVLGGTDTPITKKGPGFLQFAGSNTFTGDITVEEGVFHGLVQSANYQPFGNSANKVYLKRNGILSFAGGGTGYSTTFGDMEFAGANGLRVSVGQNDITVTVNSLSRKAGTRATLLMLGNYTSGNYYDFWAYGGTSRKFIVLNWKTPNPSPNVNRMLAPWCVLTRRESDLTKGAFAYVDAASGGIRYLEGVGASANQYHRNTLVGATASEVIDLAAAEALAANLEIYALRTSSGITASGDPTLTLGSGGLIANADLTLAPKLKFGPTGAAEALVYVGGYLGYVKTATLAGALTTSGGLTMFGEGVLALTADSSATLSGDHWVNQGTLRLANAAALAAAAVVNIERGAVVDIAGNYTLAHAFKGLGRIMTGTNLLTLTGSLTPGFSVGTLTVTGNLDFRGTLNWEFDATNSTDVVACETLTFGNSAAKIVNASWLGAGDAPEGDYTLFTYTGADPSVVPGEWTVNAPSGKVGTVVLDAANNQVLLRIGKLPSGTLLMLR